MGRLAHLFALDELYLGKVESFDFGDGMKNSGNTAAIDKLLPVKTLKDWKKPVLDILKLESAQHGRTGLPDGISRHRSA